MTRAILAALVVLTGCLPTLAAQSAQPPGRTARLDEVHSGWGFLKGYRLQLSQGTAIAVSCTHGGPCNGLSVVSDDPSIAEIRRASLGTLERTGFSSYATSAAVVVVGKAPGTTKIKVRTSDGDRIVPVTVISQPGPMASQATAHR